MADGDIALILRKIMRLRNLTQLDLAQQLKLTQPSVSRLLAGAEAKHRNREKILALARRLNVINNSEAETLKNQQGVRVVAVVGPQGELRLLTENEQEVVPRPPGMLATALVAATVVGRGMMPMLDDGWAIYWDQMSQEPIDNRDQLVHGALGKRRYHKDPVPTQATRRHGHHSDSHRRQLSKGTMGRMRMVNRTTLQKLSADGRRHNLPSAGRNMNDLDQATIQNPVRFEAGSKDPGTASPRL
jgi:transcriptional regulator with XRE-family HTH domain